MTVEGTAPIFIEYRYLAILSSCRNASDLYANCRHLFSRPLNSVLVLLAEKPYDCLLALQISKDRSKYYSVKSEMKIMWMSLQREKRTKFSMWKAIIHRKRKYSEVLPCDRESYSALSAMQGGSSATLPPSLDAFRACKYCYFAIDVATV